MQENKLEQKVRLGIVARVDNENNPAWKGDKVGYKGLHTWVRRHKGHPTNCSNCGREGNHRQICWANISGLYKRDLNDFIALCNSCHKLKDYTEEWKKKLSLAARGKNNPFFGKTHSEKTKRIISEFASQRKWIRNKLGHFVKNIC